MWSVDYLNDWIKDHPGKNDPEAPMWIKFAKRTTELEPMQYGTIRMRLNKLDKKAGINKKIHPHLFRHSRATDMANYLTEAQMNMYFDGVQGSNMPSIYVHLSRRDIDNAVLTISHGELCCPEFISLQDSSQIFTSELLIFATEPK